MEHDPPDFRTEPFRGSNHAPLDPQTEADVIVVGAGPAGLAVAACLVQRGHSPLVIDRAQDIASSWRHHYERLHLHTVKSHSALPGRPFPDDAPRYVPRQGVVDYLVAYARQHGIEPMLGLNVTAIEPRQEVQRVSQQVYAETRHVASAKTLLVMAERAPRFQHISTRGTLRRVSEAHRI